MTAQEFWDYLGSFEYFKLMLAHLWTVSLWGRMYISAVVILALWCPLMALRTVYVSRVNQRVYRAFDQLANVVRLAGSGTRNDVHRLTEIRFALEKSLATPILGWKAILPHPEQISMLTTTTNYQPVSVVPLVPATTELTLSTMNDTINFANDALDAHDLRKQAREDRREDNELNITYFNETTGRVELTKASLDLRGKALHALVLSLQELKKNPSAEELTKAVTAFYNDLCQRTGMTPDQSELNDLIEQAHLQGLKAQYGLTIVT